MAKKSKKKAAKKKAARRKASTRRTARTTTRKTGRKAGKKTARKTARKATKKKGRRTVMYSSKGKKLYAVRAKSGQFKDIQQYSRAHAADLRRKSAAEEVTPAESLAVPMGESASDALGDNGRMG